MLHFVKCDDCIFCELIETTVNYCDTDTLYCLLFILQFYKLKING